MLAIKPGVRAFGVRPEVVLALAVARDVYARFGFDLTVTSIMEGEHTRASLHYTGAAADLRLPPANLTGVVDALKAALGDDFDVVAEVDHLHIEFQPKAPY